MRPLNMRMVVTCTYEHFGLAVIQSPLLLIGHLRVGCLVLVVRISVYERFMVSNTVVASALGLPKYHGASDIISLILND